MGTLFCRPHGGCDDPTASRGGSLSTCPWRVMRTTGHGNGRGGVTMLLVIETNSEIHRLEPNSFGTLYFVRLRAGAGYP